MLSLLQAAMLPPNGPSWQGIAVVFGALLQGAVLSWMNASAKDRASLHVDVTTLKNEIIALNTHVGVDGNGIMARLDAITMKLDRISEEMAESRGARHIRTQGGS
jgi:hypothetical protein